MNHNPGYLSEDPRVDKKFPSEDLPVDKNIKALSEGPNEKGRFAAYSNIKCCYFNKPYPTLEIP